MGVHWQNMCPIAKSICFGGIILVTDDSEPSTFWRNTGLDTVAEIDAATPDKGKARCIHWDGTGSKCKLWA